MHYKIIAIYGDLAKKNMEISYIHLEENGGMWACETIANKKIEMSSTANITGLLQMPMVTFNKVDQEVTMKLTAEINKFITETDLSHKVDFIAFGGIKINDQLFFGNAATLAAFIPLPILADFHKLNIVLNGNNNIYAIAETLLQMDAAAVQEKQNIALALLAALRWREAYNIFGKDTKATKDHIAGAIWLGADA